LARQDLLVMLALLDHKVYRAIQALQGRKVRLAIPDPPDHKGFRVYRAFRGKPGLLDHKARLAHKVPQDPPARRVIRLPLPDLPDRQDRRAIKAI
jgi:hypothetical protein